MDGASMSSSGVSTAAPEGTRRVPRPTRARGGVVDALADATAAVDAREDGAAGNDGADVRVADGKPRTLERPGHALSGQRQPERRRAQTPLQRVAMLAAPLLAGNDLRSMPSAVQTILTNTEIIAVDQDPLGKQARLVATPQSGLEVWSKTLSGSNARAVALLNRNAAAASISVTFGEIGLSSGAASVRDLWQHAELGTFNGSYTAASVPNHGVVMLRIAQ